MTCFSFQTDRTAEMEDDDDDVGGTPILSGDCADVDRDGRLRRRRPTHPSGNLKSENAILPPQSDASSSVTSE